MSQYTLSVKAEDDLISIGKYTQKKWGKKQRTHYLHEIDSTFPLLADNPKKGRSCDEIRRGYLRYNVGKHAIFYRQIKNDVEIIRILHQSMDFSQHLS